MPPVMVLVRALAPLLFSTGLASGSALVELTDSTFEEFISGEAVTLVEFYAPWCGHCKTLAPEYDSAANKLAEFDIKIANLDATAATVSASKFDVSGYPTLKVFRDGEVSGDFDGERTGHGIFHYMRHAKDPSYEIPRAAADAGWEGDKGAVAHLTDADFDEYRQQNPLMLTMFYAPWCGHCKTLKPEFAKASTKIEEALTESDSKISMTAMDCTIETVTCAKYGVEGYPTIFYFPGSEDEPVAYEDARSAKGLTSFLMKKVDPEWKPVLAPYKHNEAWAEEDFGNGNVVHLDDDYFSWYRNEKAKGGMFTMFYAPWCGHCKTLKPDWVAASESGPKSVVMAAVDCTVASETCQTVGTEGYPTLRFFEPLVEGSKEGSPTAESGETYIQMARAIDDLVWYTRDKADRLARKEAKSVTADTDFSKLKMKALKKLLKDRGEKCEGCTDKSEFVAKVKEVFDKPIAAKPKAKRTLMQEKRYQEAKAVADAGWAEESYGNGNVAHLLDGDFEPFQKTNSPMLVMFYAPWCGHCKTLKPEFAKVSEDDSVSAKMVAIDCTGNPETCQKFKATSYPTVHWFQDGADSKGRSFDGGRTAKAMAKWIKTAVDPSYKDPSLGPFVNQPLWKDESHGDGKIVHLDDEHFASYRADHPVMITMFYAPWCGHCKTFKPEFVAASEEAADDGVTLSAIDCTVNNEVCSQFGVEGYPSIKVFTDATTNGYDFEGARDKAGVLKLVDELGSEIVIDKDEL